MTNEYFRKFCAYGSRKEILPAIMAGTDIHGHGMELITPNKSTPGQLSMTPLMTAAQAGNEDVVRTLLSFGADAEKELVDGTTALHLLLEQGKCSVKTVAALLAKSPQLLNAATENLKTPLLLAVQTGNLLVIRFLLKAGANVNVQDNDGNTPISFAVQTRCYSAIRLLLKAKADVNLPNDVGYVPLHWAAKNNDIKSMRLLLQAGAFFMAADSLKCTALHYAANYGSYQACYFLLKIGADIHKKTLTGDTAIHLAAKEGNDKIVQLLILAGADIRERNEEGQTSLHAAMEIPERNRTARLLLQKGNGDKNWLNAQDNDGLTALHYAVLYRNASLVEQLLNAGCSTQIRENIFGDTPADIITSYFEKEENESCPLPAGCFESEDLKIMQLLEAALPKHDLARHQILRQAISKQEKLVRKIQFYPEWQENILHYIRKNGLKHLLMLHRSTSVDLLYCSYDTGDFPLVVFRETHPLRSSRLIDLAMKQKVLHFRPHKFWLKNFDLNHRPGDFVKENYLDDVQCYFETAATRAGIRVIHMP